MLRPLSLAIAGLIAAQTPDDMVLCTSASDCPVNAACEDGVCVERVVKKKRKKQRKRKVRRRDPNRCRRGDCVEGQECYRGSCGPPVPSSGTGLVIAGGVVTGVSLLFFAAAGVCQLNDANPEREQNVCTAVEIGIGVVALAVGVPMLIVGVLRKSTFNEWVRTYHPQLALTPKEEGAVASLGFSF